MATNTAQTPDMFVPRVVTIKHDHDLTLRVTEYTEPLKAGEVGRDKTRAVVDFHVTRQPLIDSSNGQYIQDILATPEFVQHGNHIINLDEHDPRAVEAILCAIYRKNDDWKSSALGQEVVARTLNLHWEKLWDVVVSNRLLMVKSTLLNEWYALWYERHGQKPDSRLLYPCFVFNHAKGFASITKDLVHNHAYNDEYKSQKHPDLRVPFRVINALNAARGHKKNSLSRWIWSPMETVLEAGCDCKENTFFLYFKALKKTGGHPVEQQTDKSVSEVCHLLDSFSSHFTMRTPRQNCPCRRNWVRKVGSAVSETRKHFDGLCLGCMQHTEHKFLEDDSEYWGYVVDKHWDKHCRVSHDQASWYSSFMGRPDTRAWLLKRDRVTNRSYSAA
ncbi:hypothetical protein KCV07_g4207, partial [Aureobasidium melanogenum]